MADALRRGIRTFFQAFVGMLAILLVPFLNDLVRRISGGEDYELDPAFWQGVIVAACASGLVALIAWAQNLLEDKGAVPALLKGPASSGANPVPDPTTSDAVKP